MIARVDILLSAAAGIMGILCAVSAEKWMSASQTGAQQMAEAKQELMKTAGLFELHNAVYSRVGPAAWEYRVKPQFMSDITRATARETGNWLPDWRDIVAWTKAHPEEARRLLLDAEASTRE